MNNAIILAAGLSSRFVPLSYERPKGLLKVKGEILIERQISQLKEAGIKQIIVVVGYQAHKFEYLKDKFGVELIYNPEYRSKNNLESLLRASKFLNNTYILSSDNYLSQNPFKSKEKDSWYMGVYSAKKSKEWFMSEDEQGYINAVSIGGQDGYYMMGPVFFNSAFSKEFCKILNNAKNDIACANMLWEELFMQHLDKLKMRINKVSDDYVYEFDSLAELREFDNTYQEHSNNIYLANIAKLFNTSESKIINLRAMDAGMSNRSFSFELDVCGGGCSYIYRIASNDAFINRAYEAATYQAIKHLNISDEVLFFDPISGDKISKYIEGARCVNHRNDTDLINIISLLKRLHLADIKVPYEFDFRSKIELYLNACQSIKKSKDFDNFYQTIKLLLADSRLSNRPQCLCHMDFVSDNILCANEKYYLIDWEYASMCDPLAELAQFGLYSYLNERELLALAKLYKNHPLNNDEQFCLFAYTAISGFMWYLWSLVYIQNGCNYHDYALKQYKLAKTFAKAAQRVKNV